MLCGSQHYQSLFTVSDYTLNKCVECHLVQTYPLPAQESFDNLYDEEYFTKLACRKEQELVYHRRILHLIEQYKISGSMLEVGIGAGFFLELAQQQGWNIQGIEPSEAACRYVSQTVSVPICNETLETAHLTPKSIDTIVLRHVLEHIAEPQMFMRELRRILKDDGLMCLVVPNFGGLHARVEREAWFHLSIPYHVAHYTKRPLQQLIDENGFDVVRFMTTDLSCNSYLITLLNILRHILQLAPIRRNVNPSEINPKKSLQHWLISKERIINSLMARIGLGEELTVLLKKRAT